MVNRPLARPAWRNDAKRFIVVQPLIAQFTRRHVEQFNRVRSGDPHDMSSFGTQEFVNLKTVNHAAAAK